jgi:hypothetical protein
VTIDVELDRDVGEMFAHAAEELNPDLAKAVLKAANYGGGVVTETVFAKFPKGTSALARSFLPAKFISAPEGTIAAGAMSDLPYARIQDEGGTIRPKHRKTLAVPISKEAKTKWPRDWPGKDLALIKSKRGNLLLIGAKEKELTVHYVLKESVKIQGRNYLGDAKDEAAPVIEKMVGEDVAIGVRASLSEAGHG